jgi:hypothetical protein
VVRSPPIASKSAVAVASSKTRTCWVATRSPSRLSATVPNSGVSLGLRTVAVTVPEPVARMVPSPPSPATAMSVTSNTSAAVGSPPSPPEPFSPSSLSFVLPGSLSVVVPEVVPSESSSPPSLPSSPSPPLPESRQPATAAKLVAPAASRARRRVVGGAVLSRSNIAADL